MEFLTSPELWIAFATLLLLEIVLGIDNVVFISILSGRLPEHQQARARTIGISLALITRLLLLASLSWIIGLTAPLFEVLGQEISGRDLILLLGGLFLVGKATYEIHEHLEGSDHSRSGKKVASFGNVIAQILVLDVVFSLDSVITAVGMVDELAIMVAAVVIAMIIMLVSAGAVANFVNQHPTVKMLALSFLLIIGASLIAESFDQHIPKGYVYGPIAFSIFVEFLNLRVRARQRRQQETKPVQLHPTYVKSGSGRSEPEAQPEATPAG
ncbi:Membrane protein TerC, possibly involved in tellurium resistance [Micromonospora phaseoli]|uniref:Membrane protein TerC, possibly involved in tellurium resistance n=1 Tax=Micromonospora phaseoli TaxID=1144548 RepID=A0A1H7D9R8_9ACTN|nr:TerC family protein [Micromonospora phaseoli]PZV90922.1 putative tellurium resistance membrane protein TerC [Micromonospora phaseoli]GIJ77407.1 membrane protein [Micromonospora phaseoli]SEJ98603.1 Membrane protein TerC, possibly involved in tellurium resistance [Micromonospora phaseoli]